MYIAVTCLGGTPDYPENVMAVRGDPSALAAGKAFADVSSWRAIGVSGSDARRWLNDLVTADIEDLQPGRARQSLLLTPQGAVLASFSVGIVDGDIVLLQDPEQPRSIEDLLAPFVLSSDVAIDRRDATFAIFAFPGRGEAPEAPGSSGSIPSCVGMGADVMAPGENHDLVSSSLTSRFSRATMEDLEAWRVTAGIPKVGLDTGRNDLPQECGLEWTVSYEKGCFLGQEAVAKMRNRGHPRRILVRIEADDEIEPDERIVADGEETGGVSSLSAVNGHYVGLARIRWEHRERPLTTSRGVELMRRAVV
jgi:hypothetical protein